MWFICMVDFFLHGKCIFHAKKWVLPVCELFCGNIKSLELGRMEAAKHTTYDTQIMLHNAFKCSVNTKSIVLFLGGWMFNSVHLCFLYISIWKTDTGANLYVIQEKDIQSTNLRRKLNDTVQFYCMLCTMNYSQQTNFVVRAE